MRDFVAIKLARMAGRAMDRSYLAYTRKQERRSVIWARISRPFGKLACWRPAGAQEFIETGWGF
jgi:hypothetical protein